MRHLITLSAFLALLLLQSSYAQDLPYFASTKSQKVNARTGPDLSYPIAFTILNKGEPVKILQRFNDWRKVCDVEGEVGWIHSSLLSNQRSVIVRASQKSDTNIYKLPYTSSSILSIAENNVRCRLVDCYKDWCYIECQKQKGWIKRQDLWGIEVWECKKTSSLKFYWQQFISLFS